MFQLTLLCWFCQELTELCPIRNVTNVPDETRYAIFIRKIQFQQHVILLVYTLSRFLNAPLPMKRTKCCTVVSIFEKLSQECKVENLTLVSPSDLWALTHVQTNHLRSKRPLTATRASCWIFTPVLWYNIAAVIIIMTSRVVKDQSSRAALAFRWASRGVTVITSPFLHKLPVSFHSLLLNHLSFMSIYQKDPDVKASLMLCVAAALLSADAEAD